MVRNYSPLRYPGGKRRLSDFFINLLDINNYQKNITFVEPYAGGAGCGLTLLFNDRIERLIINEKERGLYCFWDSLIHHPHCLIEMIGDCEVTIEEWNKVREKFFEFDSKDNLTEKEQLELGFLTFYLNSCNWNGVLCSGPIGGRDQTGKQKLDFRFNKKYIIQKLWRVVGRKDSIEVRYSDAIDCTFDVIEKYKKNAFIFLDPPYYGVGDTLYKTHYKTKDHIYLESVLLDLPLDNWCLTYNNCQQVKDLYNKPGYKVVEIDMDYAVSHKKTTELFICRDGVLVPEQWRIK